MYEKNYKAFEKHKKKITGNLKRIFIKKQGFIWHHLKDFVKEKDIVEENGSWIKTDMKIWKHALSKSLLKERQESCKLLKCKITQVRTINGCFGRDIYEVFFDSKV